MKSNNNPFVFLNDYSLTLSQNQLLKALSRQNHCEVSDKHGTYHQHVTKIHFLAKHNYFRCTNNELPRGIPHLFPGKKGNGHQHCSLKMFIH